MKDPEIKEEQLKYILDKNIGWIENCDAKATTVLSCIGVIFSILLAAGYVDKLITAGITVIDTYPLLGCIYYILLAITILIMFAGCVMLVLVLVPKTDIYELEDKDIKTDSLLYFGSIAERDNLSDYKNEILNCSLNVYNEDLISQIYICSVICQRKFSKYKNGLMHFFIGFVELIILTIISYFVS